MCGCIYHVKFRPNNCEICGKLLSPYRYRFKDGKWVCTECE